ncbi:GNAT family N-acetyltransferase [Alicyclobacillus fastidiosus]|uniref:GNAT family protein n=1 Tax=Alicyclobacillus fastidiosus TaxID=392011 RepID=A0ABV5AHL9_9BACL|nr:GNAT family protein [Alicyclobacillus fastidiosus]WEH11526.1 GNAT family protein [Alicyclobacillus fastidiosus]
MIIGQRTKIRAFEENDAILFNKWRNDPEFSKLSFGEYLFPESLDETHKWCNKLIDDEYTRFLTITTVDDRVIGRATIYDIDWRNRNCSFGSSIGEQVDRSKGYGSDARRALLNYIFHQWDFRRVFGCFGSYNMASKRSHEKVGAHILGDLKRMLFIDGEYYSLVHYEYRREDFQLEDKTLW